MKKLIPALIISSAFIPVLLRAESSPHGGAMNGTTEVFQANENWRPITWEPARIIKGSALDFSGFLETPAGKRAAVVIHNGQFVFADAPQTPVRIYGTVVSHGLPFVGKQQCEQLADFLAASGYNGVRLHNYNFAKGVMKEIGSTEFTPLAMDQLDYFFFCLKKRGIYFTFPLNAWGFFKAGDVKDIPEFRDRAFRFESNGLLPISQDAQKWFKEYSLNLLTHINPYTGMALKDDPALLSIELANEDSLLAVLGQYPEFVAIYREKCREHLKAMHGAEPAKEQIELELPRYVLQLQEEYVEMMTKFLRDAGVRQPLTDLNFRDNMVYAIPRSMLDYVDIHGYWALYRALPGPIKNGSPPYRQSWVNPNTVGWGIFLGPVAGRLFDKPYMNSEFNGCYPSPYWSFTGPAEAVIAASQGWSGVFRCGIGPRPETFFNASPVHQIGHGSSPLMMLSERIGAMLFAQGEVKPLPVKLPFVVTPQYLMSKVDLSGGPKYPPSYSHLAFRYQIGTVLLDGSEHLEGYQCLVAPADMEIPASLSGKTILRADTTLEAQLKKVFSGESNSSVPMMTFDAGQGSAQIVTPRCETFLLSADERQAAGNCVSLAGNETVALCFAGSLDRKPVGISKHLLAMYLTDLKNTDTEIEYQSKNKESVIVRNSGTLPLLVHQGRIVMSFKRRDGPLPHVWALKYDGSRSVEVQPQRTTDGFSFEANAVTSPDTFCTYELAWD